jgi:hypothetical protein
LVAVSRAWCATASFDDLMLSPNSYWYGPDPNGKSQPDPDGGDSPVIVGSFTSGGAKFVNRYHSSFGSWDGFAYSNMTDTTTPGFSNQFSAFTGTGHGPGPDNYGVAYGYLDQQPNFNQSFAFNPNNVSQLQMLPYFDVPTGQHASSMYVTNMTYAALSMRDGDSFAKKFGGASGNDPDFFKLSVYGTDANNAPLGTQVDFYLADYRFSNNAQDYIVDQWTQVNLSALASATRLYFNLSSTDISSLFGMNTPSTFAIDDVEFSPNWKAGDFNLDGHVDARDIKSMAAALANLNAYQHGGNSQSLTLADSDLNTIGDLNGDHKINNADLQFLLNELKTGGGSTSVPEPGSFFLLVIGGFVLAGAHHRRLERCI